MALHLFRTTVKVTYFPFDVIIFLSNNSIQKNDATHPIPSKRNKDFHNTKLQAPEPLKLPRHSYFCKKKNPQTHARCQCLFFQFLPRFCGKFVNIRAVEIEKKNKAEKITLCTIVFHKHHRLPITSIYNDDFCLKQRPQSSLFNAKPEKKCLNRLELSDHVSHKQD